MRDDIRADDGSRIITISHHSLMALSFDGLENLTVGDVEMIAIYHKTSAVRPDCCSFDSHDQVVRTNSPAF